MKNKLAPYLPLAWLLSIPVLNVCYGILNRGGADTAQLITAWDRLIEQSKMELITGVSHDLRTPLTSMIGYLNLLKNDDYKNL
ncbi:histidine kinase dimerization/phospho-acceptor domain-containing protein, partial [Paenibacillus sp.]|uniref:histidine kinase dimerization/phospho-acceptor domain-containing protein n=1 Tax=Paenibacillus sp. TaxID=58172 RepID=UPI0028181DA9